MPTTPERPAVDRFADLFTHPRIVLDLLRGYVREGWVERLDASSLELWPVPAADPLDVEILRPLLGCAVWRARLRGGRSWIYLILALPQEVMPWMALCLGDRICRLDLDLESRGLLRGRRLPARVPLVLYRGRELWTAARDLADLAELSLPSLERWQPRLRYLLLDALREPLPEGAGRDNLASRLFNLERSRSLDEIAGHVYRLDELLSGPANSGLRQAFGRYLADDLLPRLFPGADLPAIHDLAEAGPRLREAVVEWTARWQEHRRGLAGLLLRLLERKYGPLDPEQSAEVETADAARLLAWGERSATAATLQEVFGDES